MKRMKVMTFILGAVLSAVFVLNFSAAAVYAEDVYENDMLVDPLTGWEKYDTLIDQIRSETDLALRAEMMHLAEDILMGTWCVIPIYYYDPGDEEAFGTFYLCFNAKSSLFEGKSTEQAAAMRKAFCILINRQAISVDIVDRQDIANAFIPLGLSDGNGGIFKTDLYSEGYFDPRGMYLHHDATVNEARALLESAGYTFDENGCLSAATPIRIRYLTNDNENIIKVAEYIQKDFAEIGAEMEIVISDWETILEERQEGKYDLCREGWIVDYNDPINMLEMFTTDSETNDCQFGR